jgi:ribose transport system substrate-binding protein
MNRNHRHIRPLAGAAAAVLMLSVAGCADSESDAPSAASTSAAAAADIPYDGPEATLPHEYPAPTKGAVDSCKIGYQNIYSAIPALAAAQDAAEQEAKDLGCDFIALDDKLTPTTQVDNFNQLIAQDVDAILVYPIVSEGLTPSIKQAQAAGIKVVAQDTPVDASEPLLDGYDTVVLQGFDTAAYLRAAGIAKAQPGAKFGIIGLGAPVAAVAYFNDRTKYWAEKFGLEFLGRQDVTSDDPAAAASTASGMLAKYPDLDVLFCYNDNTAVAAATVAKSSGKSDIKVVGNNGQGSAFEAIKSGAMFSTQLTDTAGLGKQMVDGAYNLIAGVEVPERVVVNVDQVDKDSVDGLTPIG